MDSAFSADAAAQSSAPADDLHAQSPDDRDETELSDDYASVPTENRVFSGGFFQILLPVAVFLLVLDQVSKIWATKALGNGQAIDLFWTARFRLVYNEGAAFSIGESLTPAISVAAIVMAVAVVYVGRRVQSTPTLISLGLILGGAVGNVVDRFFRDGEGFLSGAVVDFIDFQWWPVFNVADIGIVVGGIGVVLFMSRHSSTSPD